jgi:hypothetical protein
MGDHLFRGRATVLALVVAVACTGLVGYVVSRPPAPPQTKHSPRPSIAPVIVGPSPTAQAIAVGYTVADDPVTDQIVVYGGSSGSGSDTWIWKGNWTLVSPSMQPPPLTSATAAFDPALGMVLLTGGEPFDVAENNGTWGWDGTNWRELNADISQPPIGGGTMAWDPALRQMVMVTGASVQPSSVSQTWIWSGNTWVSREARAPFQSAGVVLGFDQSLNALMAVSCCVATPTSPSTAKDQTWRWDGSSWHLFATTLVSSLQAFVGMGWDSITNSFVLCGQQFTGPLTSVVMPVIAWRLVGDKWVALKTTPSPDVSSASLIETEDGLRLAVANSMVGSDESPYAIWARTETGWKQLS